MGDICGVPDNMPRSSAAVLTLVSTRSCPESCELAESGESVEVPWDEWDTGSSDGLDSGDITGFDPAGWV